MNHTDVDTYRTAAHAVAQDQNAPVPVAIYAGAATAAVRRSQLAGGGRFTPELLDELTSDRLAHAAAVEVGPVGCLSLEQWVCDEWQTIDERAAEAVPFTRTEAENMYRRATIELLIEADDHASMAAISFAAALAVAHIRWHSMGIDGSTDPAATDVIHAVLDEDPVASLAREQLDEATRASLAMAVGNQWRAIMERVQIMEMTAAIEAAA
ncbi:hypothetical protein BKG58_19975 [Mycobacteroides abscessus subsp. abscessus]|uniref:hypothetical protein n=1 Tax=Mycobacteroides abscessus TaxID=36809 RepID=UPI00034754D9|nr:hypothetical protein [Mycobacteroides abscessus]OLT79709.1 hypothetical protein BKG58_19975 [Mycobacteroides abscessus subsp. abscessus]SHP95908.1 Uncharacterised protein [Mycobacteroides abscessus subsp. abscessus]SKO07279.1 Uncharacterised protein [Mycobacteroides abscessus subsp. abscessus]